MAILRKIRGIYLIEKIVNDNSNKPKFYIGQSEDIFERLNQHCCNNEQRIDKEIHENGILNFRFQLLEVVPNIKDLKKCETKWINSYKEKYGENMMFNISQTSNTNPYNKVSREIKSKIKELFKEDLGQSIYAISDYFKIPWSEVVKIRKSLLKEKGYYYDRKSGKIVNKLTGEEPKNWCGALFTKSLADRISKEPDIDSIKYVSKTDLNLFLNAYKTGNYEYAPELMI